MGELTAIGYTPGHSMLHRLDPRTKQALLMGVSVVSVWGQVAFLASFSLLLFFSFWAAGVRIGSLVREIRFFLFFLLFVFGLRTVAIDGDWALSYSTEAAKEAFLICWRLLLVVLMGVLLVATTRTAHIRAAMIWFLKPVPFVKEQMAATMVGMVVRFLPLILFRAGEISDALRSRSMQRRKHAVFRMMIFTTVLFRRVFLDADEFALAMQARCYNEQRTPPLLVFTRLDAVAVGMVFLLSLTMLAP